ncbi:hypothetical protein PCC7424_5019 [Gloeothece citriformis PCC 7424]|uniref:AprE-like beta-barrel domain-containing protein n=1 Tax=Gloeothece citriformis (strain PCC 7424) TaxID=65393 RepID=B7KFP7_GLOC7|nr:HlyD family efflux transporter periplasmic adaptor subunit [Gloeothece citriformis]ACK73372.1 hypothetical protein PCC7424_5019 [Gloeothece citriformis PCC 7424]
MRQLKSLKASLKRVLLTPSIRIKRRIILWIILGIVTVGISQLVFAKVKPVFYLTGELKGQETVEKILLPQDSILDEIYVKEGEKIEKGQTLLSFNVINSLTKLKQLETLQNSLKKEIEFYQSVINNSFNRDQQDEAMTHLKLSQEKMALVKSKINLIEEKKRLKDQVVEAKNQVALKLEQLEQLESGNVPNSSADSLSSKQKLDQRIEQLRNDLKNAETQQQEEKKRLDTLKNLLANHAISEQEYLEQEQLIQDRQQEINKLRLELETFEAVFEPEQTDYNKLLREKNKKELFKQISGQQDQIVLMQKNLVVQEEQSLKIDQEFKKIIGENQTKINNINSQIQLYKKRIKAIDLISPISGKISQINLKQPQILEIIPENELIAEVFVPYENRQLIKKNQKVEVILDEFDKKQWIRGKIVSIGSDILFPNQVYPFYRLPIYISLDKKTIISNHQDITLKPGMRVTAKLTIEEKSTILENFYTNVLFKIYQIQDQGGL